MTEQERLSLPEMPDANASTADVLIYIKQAAMQIKNTNSGQLKQLELQEATNKLIKSTMTRVTWALLLGASSLILIILLALGYFTSGRQMIDDVRASSDKLDESIRSLKVLKKESLATRDQISKVKEQVEEQAEGQPTVVADTKTGELRLELPVKKDVEEKPAQAASEPVGKKKDASPKASIPLPAPKKVDLLE